MVTMVTSYFVSGYTLIIMGKLCKEYEGRRLLVLTHAITPFDELWLLNPRPYMFTTSFCHVMGSATLHHAHSPEISDVIDELADCSALNEIPKDHNNALCAKLPKC